MKNLKKQSGKLIILNNLDNLIKSIDDNESILNEVTNDYNEIMNRLENINNRITKI
jgi:hypothetical protein